MTPSDLIKAYSSEPINNHVMDNFTVCETQDNSVCWDTLTIYLKIDKEGIITDYSHHGKPQMFTLAAASMLAEVIIWEHIETVLRRGGEYMKNDLWLAVSPRRQRSTVTALLAVHHAIMKYQWHEDTETYEEIIGY